jgi:uncharacterized protein YbbC (DUF1343 family)
MTLRMEVGLDRVEAFAPRLRGRRFGLLAHPASVDRRLRHVSQVLREQGLRPSIVFGPEHGYGGEAQDMIAVDDAKDRDGVPIRSLYGDNETDLVPSASDLNGLDVLLIDLQDVGSRYYTFVWTALLAYRAASALGIETLILDRPNPIGRSEVEGALPVSRTYLSFVGLEPIPIRHGLTLGELVRFCAEREGLALDLLTVVAVRGLSATDEVPQWDRAFVLPSPNMPTYDTARVYPGGCLLEGTNLSEGRGTTRPFEIFGAPWLDGETLAQDLAALELPGFVARPTVFLPTFQKHARQVCGGVQVHVTANSFRPVATYAAAIALAHQQNPEAFAFRTERYEFRDDVPALDLLVGGPTLREAILALPPRGSAAVLPAIRDVAETVSRPSSEMVAELARVRQRYV